MQHSRSFVAPTVRLALRHISSSLNMRAKKSKKVPPKNFSEIYLKGTTHFIQRQLSDPYVKKRRLENYRCRSAFKLIEIDDEFKFIKPGSVVIDLGAAPGSWSQVAQDRTKLNCDVNGLVIAVDIVYFPPLDGVHAIVGDFTSDDVQRQIENIVKNNTNSARADIVLCDAAPKASGVKSFDHSIIVNLASCAAKFALKNLNGGGVFLFKIFSGEKVGLLMKRIQPFFERVKSIKPNASRKESSEFYVLCTGFKFPGERNRMG